MNGHLSPDPAIGTSTTGERRRSESDLSDVHNGPSVDRSPSPSGDADGGLNGIHDGPDMAESDEPTPDNASEDADFDMQDSPPSHHEEDVVRDRASSVDSNRALKRKAAPVEDDFIRANPELYGLRRSVRAQNQNMVPACNCSLTMSTDPTSGAAQTCMNPVPDELELILTCADIRLIPMTPSRTLGP